MQTFLEEHCMTVGSTDSIVFVVLLNNVDVTIQKSTTKYLVTHIKTFSVGAEAMNVYSFLSNSTEYREFLETENETV